MAYSLMTGAVSFIAAWILGLPFISLFKRLNLVKQVGDDVPASHLSKTGTPTLGGILIFVPVLLATVPFNLVGRLSMLLPLGMIMSCGILGAVDDLLSLVGRKTSGLTSRFKFAWLTVFAILAAIVLYFSLGARSVFIPSLGKFDLGIWYLPIATLAILGMANAVNLTDGLDALAGGTAAIAYAAYGVIAFLQGQQYLVTFCFTVVGATMAFLWFNVYPAQLFMGDTGSLALGATLATVAFMTGQWLLLPLIGLVFVMEAGSVLLQVAYFRATKGKRLFKMSPLHHHFELKGWPETQVTMRFWILGMLGAIVGVALALI
ncbi:MAG: phospho-N-acetylmuramoyl-pentapeptide-transferase [Chloroflexi bacterium]|nr:phospho-N-acetylmuramoyl-pentapeptide-transferase [Chloroflexota bacterium]